VSVKAGPQEVSLREHNRLRRIHGSPPLTLDASLSKGAEQYALELAAQGSLRHSSGAGEYYGENICRHTDPVKCVQFWYDEIGSYNFKLASFSKATGHFTALVWRSSRRLGHGQARDKKGIYYVVARYTPKGNVKGRFRENVPIA
ncbi:hypothetical protein KR084_008243, partial [Drosophila pseudotakahashii]